MQDAFLIGILSIPIGYTVRPLLNGKLPLISGWRGGNRILFGNNSVDPKLLKGIRARINAFLICGIFILLVIVIFTQDTILKSYLEITSTSICGGIIIGFILYGYALRKN